MIYTVLGTTLNIAMTMLAAYPLSRKDLKGRGVIMKLFTFTMLFGGGMIPNYLLMSNLNLLNTVWVMIIPGAISVYNMIVARTYIVNSIPSELYESASLDGCTDDRYLWSIVLPLSKPIIAVLVLWYAVGHWNAYFNAMIYLKDKSRSPLQIVLREFLIVEDMSEANIADNIEAYGLDREELKYPITNNIREAAARVKDFFYCIAEPEPTYLGEEIPIKTASASLTDDKIKV